MLARPRRDWCAGACRPTKPWSGNSVRHRANNYSFSPLIKEYASSIKSTPPLAFSMAPSKASFSTSFEMIRTPSLSPYTMSPGCIPVPMLHRIGLCRCPEANPQDIKIDHGDKWRITERMKTGTVSEILLLPEAIELINKHKGGEKLFPVPSNQKMKAFLKEIHWNPFLRH